MATTLQECELHAALAHWLTSNGYASSYRILVNFPATGHTNLDNKIEWRIEPPVLPTAQNLIDAYNGYLAQQTTQAQTAVVKASAKTAAAAIPNWATWNEAQTTAWIDANVTDLASAKTVLRAMARMVIALRNDVFPDLEGS